MQIAPGLYTVHDDRFRFTYRVRKVCKKTAVVTIGTVIDGDTGNASYSTSYRYPLDLLEQQIIDARFSE